MTHSMTLAGMLPGSPVHSLEDLKTLPEHTVVLRRSRAQPYFRTAWTLSIPDTDIRYWTSSTWRAHHSDEDMFSDAMETMIVLYRPREEFAVGLLDGNSMLVSAPPLTPPGTLADAKKAASRLAANDPMTVIIQKIDPGPWVIYEGN